MSTITAAIVAIAIALGAFAHAGAAPDLSGVWTREDGGVFQVSEDGDTVTMVHREVTPQVRREFGFDPGDEHVVATVEGHTVRGKMHVRLPLSWKTICPESWDHWSRIELTLSDDGNTLEGRWERTNVSREGCRFTQAEWLPRRYSRVQNGAVRPPGKLSAVAVGKALAVSRFELILDASGSMRGLMGGRPKLEIAKDTMRDVIDRLPDDVQAALRVYGHRVAPGRPGACEDSELVFPFRTIDKPRFIDRIRAVQALGTTPIAHSLRQVAGDIAGAAEETIVILVTDGKEECGGSPSRAVSELLGKGLRVQVNIVGFALEEATTKQEMRRVAELTGGRFFDATNAGALRNSIEQALAVPYEVLNSAGRKVAGGLVGQGDIDVPAGTYAVVVNVTGAPPVIVRDVPVVSEKSTRLELEQRGREITSRLVAP